MATEHRRKPRHPEKGPKAARRFDPRWAKILSVSKCKLSKREANADHARRIPTSDQTDLFYA